MENFVSYPAFRLSSTQKGDTDLAGVSFLRASATSHIQPSIVHILDIITPILMWKPRTRMFLVVISDAVVVSALLPHTPTSPWCSVARPAPQPSQRLPFRRLE
jgi:hypothetical protein